MGSLSEYLLVGLLVSVAGALLATFNWRRLRNWLRHSDLLPPEPSHFTILVADLDGDPDGRQTGHVVRALEGQEGIRVLRDGRCLKIEEVGDRTANLAAATDKGRKWLFEKSADVLIWGEATEANKVLHLRLLGEDGPGDGAATGYTLSETYDLPENFDRNFLEVLLAVALAAVHPATVGQGHYVVHFLEPAATKLERLLASPPRGFTPRQRTSLLIAFGNAAQTLGEQTGESAWLEKSVASFQAALEVYTREALPFDWAMTQNNLGTALGSLGEREEGTARLEEAVSAYRSALEVRSREALPLDWAITQNNLGSALSRLGEREAGTARLEEAVSAYRAALEVYTRDALPIDWAATQNNLGNALRELGEREEGTARLEAAVSAYGAALEVYTRDDQPLDWAMTQSNLGTILGVLAERDADKDRLREAIKIYRQAQDFYEKIGAKHQLGMSSNNLGTALLSLATTTSDKEVIADAEKYLVRAENIFSEIGAGHFQSVVESNLTLLKNLKQKQASGGHSQ